MKKYLLGMTAIVLAIGFSAFTKPATAPKGKFANFTFVLKASVDPTTAALAEDITNWEVESGQPACTISGINSMACRITVPDLYVDQTQSPVVLKDATFANHIVITASDINSPTARFYVTTLKNQSGSNTGSIKNSKDLQF